MSSWLKGTLIILGVIFVVVLVALALVPRAQAIDLIYYPLAEREPIVETPAEYGLPFEDLTVGAVVRAGGRVPRI